MVECAAQAGWHRHRRLQSLLPGAAPSKPCAAPADESDLPLDRRASYMLILRAIRHYKRTYHAPDRPTVRTPACRVWARLCDNASAVIVPPLWMWAGQRCATRMTADALPWTHAQRSSGLPRTRGGVCALAQPRSDRAGAPAAHSQPTWDQPRCPCHRA